MEDSCCVTLWLYKFKFGGSFDGHLLSEPRLYLRAQKILCAKFWRILFCFWESESIFDVCKLLVLGNLPRPVQRKSSRCRWKPQQRENSCHMMIQNIQFVANNVKTQHTKNTHTKYMCECEGGLRLHRMEVLIWFRLCFLFVFEIKFLHYRTT